MEDINSPESEPLNEAPIFREKTRCSSVKSCFTNITVEPVAFLVLFANILAAITTQTLGIEKACRVNLNLSEEICDSVRNQDSDNNTQYEQMIQSYIAKHLIWKTAIQSALPCILLPFIGSWMDKTGRKKLFMIYPLVGEILQTLSSIVNVIFLYQLPVEVLYFTDAFFGGICGGWGIIFLAIFCYISDITTESNRTYRLGLVNFCTYIGMPVGLALSGVILKLFGYYAIYGTSSVLHVLNLLYVIFRLDDPPRTKEQKAHDGKGFVYFLKTFFDPTHILSTMKVVVKKTPDNRRLRLIIFLFIICILLGPMHGEIAVIYLLTRYRFNWDELNFSIFQTYNFILHIVGTMFCILVLSKYLKWHDSALGIISTVSKIASSFVYCFAATATIFYIAPVVDILGGSAVLALRSIFSKTVNPDELGKINSLIGLAENLMPLLFVPLYTQVYTATMDILPGAMFLMSAAMMVPSLAVFLWLFITYRKGLKVAKPEEAAMPMT